jgi:hypothetical protein
VVGLGHAQPIPILQQLARSDPSGRNDVRAVPTVAAKRQGYPWWSTGSTAAMMLDHLGHEDASRAIMQAIETTLKNEAARTRDLGGKADTATCGGAVAAALDQQQGRVFAS